MQKRVPKPLSITDNSVTMEDLNSYCKSSSSILMYNSKITTNSMAVNKILANHQTNLRLIRGMLACFHSCWFWQNSQVIRWKEKKIILTLLKRTHRDECCHLRLYSQILVETPVFFFTPWKPFKYLLKVILQHA